MRQTVFSKLQTIPSVLVLALAGLIGGISAVAAQEGTSVCQPPQAGEYLLLVVSPTPDSQNQLRRALPSEINTSVCKYLNDTVMRIGGFTKIDDAQGWARYVRDIVGLSTFVTTRPSEPTPSPTPSPQQPGYSPQPLGAGYAVLVDYFNRPELASQVQRVVGTDVGFVSYGQRPYLLATYTTNPTEASSTLQNLSDRGFFAMLVDSRKVIMLKTVVSY